MSPSYIPRSCGLEPAAGSPPPGAARLRSTLAAACGGWLRRAAGMALLGAVAALSLSATGAQAFTLGDLGRLGDTVNRGQDALSTGQQVLSTGRQAAETGRQAWNNRHGFPTQPPSGPAIMARDEGGITRLITTLERAGPGSLRTGETWVALLDQGAYLVQRNSAHTVPPQDQVLTAPRSDSASAALDLPATPPGTLFDLGSGRPRTGGSGVKIFALTIHTPLPRRANRRSLDAIEQHAMLATSSVQMEWPVQPDQPQEPVGGKLLVWASEAGAVFPSGFGPDGLLFTSDDPMVRLPRGYTVVTLDRRGFSFDRSREVAVTQYAVQSTTDVDLSRLTPDDALRAFFSVMQERYAYRGAQNIDWPRLQSDLTTRIRNSGAQRDSSAMAQAWSELAAQLQDGLLRVDTGQRSHPLGTDVGLATHWQPRGSAAVPFPSVWWLPDGRALVSSVAPQSAAALAGLRPGAEILEIDGESVARYVGRTMRLTHRTTEAARRHEALKLQASGTASLRLRVRQDGKDLSVDLRPAPQPAAHSAPTTNPSGDALSAFQLRSRAGKQYGYIALNAFADGQGNLDAWERSLAAANHARVRGLVLDLRGSGGSSGNGAGSYQLVPHLTASLFSYDRPLLLQGYAQRQVDATAKVWRTRGSLGVPPRLPLYAQGPSYYGGPLVLLTGPDCAGPCELFAAWLQRARRAQVVASGPTAGAVGHTTRILLPGDLVVHVPTVAEQGANGEHYVHGRGIEPDVRVPVDAGFVQQLINGADPVLDAAVEWLDGRGA